MVKLDGTEPDAMLALGIHYVRTHDAAIARTYLIFRQGC